jgi:transcriptional regulator NrdR family protein
VRCPGCTKASLVVIRVRIGDSNVTFRRCRRCDAQAWETADGQVPLGTVLELARQG